MPASNSSSESSSFRFCSARTIDTNHRARFVLIIPDRKEKRVQGEKELRKKSGISLTWSFEEQLGKDSLGGLERGNTEAHGAGTMNGLQKGYNDLSNQ